MLSLRVSRDKRGYDLIYLIWDQRRRGRPEPRLLYCCRLPAPLRVGPPPFDDEVRARLEKAYPEIEFDWTALLKSLLGAVNSNVRVPAGPPPSTFKPRRSAPPASLPSNHLPGTRERTGMRSAPNGGADHEIDGRHGSSFGGTEAPSEEDGLVSIVGGAALAASAIAASGDIASEHAVPVTAAGGASAGGATTGGGVTTGAASLDRPPRRRRRRGGRSRNDMTAGRREDTGSPDSGAPSDGSDPD